MYSEEDKKRILDKLLPPHNVKMADLARLEGVSLTSLYMWRKELGYDSQLKAAKRQMMNDQTSQAEQWLTSEDKLTIVMETYEMTSEELSQYCAANDLIAEHVLIWRENCLRANEQSETQLAIERQELRRLQRENRRLRREKK